jgi:hypothetical protein
MNSGDRACCFRGSVKCAETVSKIILMFCDRVISVLTYD